LFVECESETVLEEVGLSHFNYVISRWQTIAGSPYGVSMATSVLLPDSRTLQVVMRTLREAGEMHVNPPMLATMDAIRGDIGLYAGGITTVDMEYDQKLGDALRPISRDKSGFPIGREIADVLKQDLRSGWLIDKIQLPVTTGGSKMTATEVRRQMQEQVRGSAPIVKPVQHERNYPLCVGVFQILSENGAFPLDGMPESLEGKELKFKFRSPIDELIEQTEAESFLDGRDRVLLPAMQIDPSIAKLVNWEETTRDTLRNGFKWKQKWLNSKEDVAAERDRVEQEQDAAKVMALAQQGAEIANRGGAGAKQLVQAEMESQAGPRVPGPAASRRRA
jgi:hypothetical protein